MDPVDAVGETLPSSCPPPEQLVELASGRLDASHASAVEQHIDLCQECRVALAQVARGASSSFWQLGRYRVDRVLGSGGMGIVYLAHDPALGREVAIKVVRSDADGALAERLEREAKALARLSHPNVCHVYDVGTEGGEVWIAMELIRGTTMRDWLGSRPALREIMDILAGVARGLEAAHAAGLVHRDVKPENVLVERGGRPVVSDFGLAQVVDGTRSSALAGTPAYMAPEQLDGQPADARTDQYSFAVMAHEALAGARPRPRDVASSSLPQAVRSVLERGLADDPAARFPSVAVFVEALAAAVTAAGMTGAVQPTPGLASGSSAPLAQGSVAVSPSSTSVSPRRGRRGVLLGAGVTCAIAAAAFGGWWFARQGAAGKPPPAPLVAAAPNVVPLAPQAAAHDAGVLVALAHDAAAPASAPIAPEPAVPPAHPTRPVRPTHAPPVIRPVAPVAGPSTASALPATPAAVTGHDAMSMLALASSRAQAGDPHCLDALAAYDKAGGDPKIESTVALTRAICQMAAGQCDAGRKTAAEAAKARGSTPDQADSSADTFVSMYCKAPKTDRDRLLRALFVLSSTRSHRYSLAECRQAYATALALAPSYEPVSPSDRLRDAVRTLRLAPACFANAGSCPEAWKVAKEIDLRAPLVAGQSTDLSRRQVFQMAVGGTCFDRDQGPMNDTEVLYRMTHELTGARDATNLSIAWCKKRMDRALVAFAKGGTRELAYELTGYSAQCIAAAGDCAAGWPIYQRFAQALGEPDSEMREMYKSNRCGIPSASP